MLQPEHGQPMSNLSSGGAHAAAYDCAKMPDMFPPILGCGKLGAAGDAEVDQEIFDVQFWPYTDSNDEKSIFAATGGSNLFVCRTTPQGDSPFEIIRWWGDATKTRQLNSLCWTQDADGRPLLCVAGIVPRSILIYDMEADQEVRILSGHGKPINDLQASPTSPHIIASASEDYTIRLWDLTRTEQPCITILAGEGHKQPLLALAFHPNGRWLLSSGMDTAVALWAIPAQLEMRPDQEPLVVTYPAFITEEVHFNFVDSLAWYGDNILSRAARGQHEKTSKNEILLWTIEGFDSAAPAPVKPVVPYPGRYTRSAFKHAPTSRGFRRLLTFKADNTSRFYHRFGFLHEPDMRPILVMGNEMSKFLFWDLQRCEEGDDPAEYPKAVRATKGRHKSKAKLGSDLDRLGGLRRGSSMAASDSAALNDSSTSPYTTKNGVTASASASNTFGNPTARRFALEDPFTPLKAHCELVAETSLSSNKHFGTSRLSWSRDGKWLIATGDRGMLTVFYRREAV